MSSQHRRDMARRRKIQVRVQFVVIGIILFVAVVSFIETVNN